MSFCTKSSTESPCGNCYISVLDKSILSKLDTFCISGLALSLLQGLGYYSSPVYDNYGLNIESSKVTCTLRTVSNVEIAIGESSTLLSIRSIKKLLSQWQIVNDCNEEDFYFCQYTIELLDMCTNEDIAQLCLKSAMQMVDKEPSSFAATVHSNNEGH